MSDGSRVQNAYNSTTPGRSWRLVNSVVEKTEHGEMRPTLVTSIGLTASTSDFAV